MTMLVKFLWGLVSLAVAGTVGYYVLKNERVLNFTFPKTEFGEMLRGNLEKGREWVAGKVASLTAPAVEKGEKIISGVIEDAKTEAGGVVEKVKSEADELLNKAKQGAIESVRKTLNEKFDAAVGAPTAGTPSAAIHGASASPASQSLAQLFPLGFSVKRGLPAVFIIKNTVTSGAPLAYQVFWGDGRSEQGDISASESKTLFHIWETTGEFSIKVILGSGSGAKTYSSYILVYQ